MDSYFWPKNTKHYLKAETPKANTINFSKTLFKMLNAASNDSPNTKILLISILIWSKQ